MRTSVIVVSFRRLARLRRILEAWQNETHDVWLCDCSESGIQDVPDGVRVVRFRPDPGNRVRHAVALLTSGDLVIKADDDVMPRPGLVADFEAAEAMTRPAILGIHGRTFHGPDYYRDTRIVSAQTVQEPTRVDFVGVMTAAPRPFLAMDLAGCETPIEDLYWQMEKYPGVRKFVIPTNKFQTLQESRDAGRLCASSEARAVRKRYYAIQWVRNYKKPDRLC